MESFPSIDIVGHKRNNVVAGRKGAGKNIRTGICKLALNHGVFVKSHLIPLALTMPMPKGLPLIQFKADARSVRRWSSWYDMSLVTNEGEKILTEFDTWAISELRKNKLVWSGWGSNRSLESLHIPIEDTALGIRKIEGINPKQLRLFFLSILWRAASTTLPEFAEVQLPQHDLERLRLMILSRETEPLSFYPAHLTQLSTIGNVHNHAPIASIMKLSEFSEDAKIKSLPVFRFYFDGLIIHMHRHASDDGYTSTLGNLTVGASETLTLMTITYEKSFQRYNLMSGVRANFTGKNIAGS